MAGLCCRDRSVHALRCTTLAVASKPVFVVPEYAGSCGRRWDDARRNIRWHRVQHQRSSRPSGGATRSPEPGPGCKPGRPRQLDLGRPPRHRSGRLRAERADAWPHSGGMDRPSRGLPVPRPLVAPGTDGRADRDARRDVVGAVHRPDRPGRGHRPVPGHGSGTESKRCPVRRGCPGCPGPVAGRIRRQWPVGRPRSRSRSSPS